MKIEDKDDPHLVELCDKLIKFFPNERDRMSLFATILGASDNVSGFILESYKGDVTKVSPSCAYGLLHTYQVLNICASILQDKIAPEDIVICGFFPSDPDTAWKSREDFEERLILLVKTLYEHYKTGGKIT